MKMTKIKDLAIYSFLLISVIISHTNAQEKTKYAKWNCGLGIPYGGIAGVSLEIIPVEYLSVSGGVGYYGSSVNGYRSGWAIGSKFYINSQKNSFRPFASVFHGVVANIQKENRFPYIYENAIGNAYGGGFEYQFPNREILTINFHSIKFNLPAGYKSKPGWRTVSVGYGYYF